MEYSRIGVQDATGLEGCDVVIVYQEPDGEVVKGAFGILLASMIS